MASAALLTPEAPHRGPLAELGRFLEIQNLGLNLPFALAFLFVASGGWPSVRTTLLLVVAFVAARNAGHSFNRWTDRDLDARNPRTQDRALVTGAYSPRFALGIAAASALVLVACAALLSPLALLLSPVALLIVFGYSLTKRRSWTTTLVLGLVEAVTPAAAYAAVTDGLPPVAWLAVGAMFLWGTAFETIHSVGDLDSDRTLGLPSLPGRIGARASLWLVPGLHALALGLFFLFGRGAALGTPFTLAIVALLGGVALVDGSLLRDPTRTRRAFYAHFAFSAVFLVGVLAGLFGLP